MEPQQPPATPRTFEPPERPHTVKKKLPTTKILTILLIILLVAGGAGAYWQRDKSAKHEQTQQAAAIVKLKEQITDTQKELDAEKAKNVEAAKPVAKTVTAPSAAAIESIKASITSGNTAALQGYMAPTVSVIIAGSEGIGNRTPAQAVGDITSYIKNATDPWNFALPAATLATYRAGFYAKYFPTTLVAGKAANDMVISFSFDDNGKISTVFMAANASLLQ